jgi:hypothetical protein
VKAGVEEQTRTFATEPRIPPAPSKAFADTRWGDSNRNPRRATGERRLTAGLTLDFRMYDPSYIL